MGDDEAEHVAFGEPEDVAAGDEILVVDLGINTAAGVIEKGLAKGLSVSRITAHNDAQGEGARPLNHRAWRNGRCEIRGISRGAIQEFEVNASLGHERG